MDKQALKEFFYGGISELIHNKKFYHYSTVDIRYSKWTDEGKEALQEWMQFVGHKMIECEQEDLTRRSKELIIKGLKGENKES